MRRYRFFILFFIFLVLAVSVLSKPLIVFSVKRQLKNIFKESTVYIGGCVFKPANSLAFLDAEIKKTPNYHIKAKQIKFNYRPLSLLKLRIPRIEIKDADVMVKLYEKSAIELIREYVKGQAAKKSLFSVENAKISDLKINLKSADLNIIAGANLDINLTKQAINSLDFKADSVGYRGIIFTNSDLAADQTSAGKLYIEEIKYGKFRITGIESSANLKDKTLFLDSLSGELLDGNFNGNSFFRLDEGIDYFFNLKFTGLDLERYANDFELGERFMMTGRINGSVEIKGKDTKFKVISGHLGTQEAGGNLTIKDNKLLENIARNSKQSLKMLVDNLRDYRYNTGRIELSLDAGDLIINVALDGESGKRNLTVVLHDFRFAKEGL